MTHLAHTTELLPLIQPSFLIRPSDLEPLRHYLPKGHPSILFDFFDGHYSISLIQKVLSGKRNNPEILQAAVNLALQHQNDISFLIHNLKSLTKNPIIMKPFTINQVLDVFMDRFTVDQCTHDPEISFIYMRLTDKKSAFGGNQTFIPRGELLSHLQKYMSDMFPPPVVD